MDINSIKTELKNQFGIDIENRSFEDVLKDILKKWDEQNIVAKIFIKDYILKNL